MTPTGIVAATVRLVGQCLNRLCQYLSFKKQRHLVYQIISEGKPEIHVHKNSPQYVFTK